MRCIRWQFICRKMLVLIAVGTGLVAMPARTAPVTRCGAGLSGVTLAATPPSPQPTNASITLTATANGGAVVEYQFQITNSNGKASLSQCYSPSPLCRWRPVVPDTYTIQVWAREAGTLQNPKITATMPYTISVPIPPLTGVDVLLTPSDAATVDQPITVTAQAIGGTDPRYQFWVATLVPPSLTLLQDYSAASAVSFTPSTAGIYLFQVTAREAGKVAGVASKIQIATVKPLTGAQSDGPLQITPYAEAKTAAISYTFDDGYQSQLDYAVPLLDAYHFKATFNVITGFTRNLDSDPQLPTMDGIVTGSWASWAGLAADGHEIGNHSKTHQDLTLLTDPAQLDDEINGSANTIAAHIGHLPFTFAFPYNHETPALDALVLQRHHAIRENEAPFGDGIYTAAEMNAAVDQAVQQGQWLVPQMHGFLPQEYGPVSPQILDAHLAYVQSRAADLWVDTYGHVSRYAQERDHALLALYANQNHQMLFTLTTSLDPTVFNGPLTVQVTTGQPTVATASANLLCGATLPTTIQPGGIVQLDVVPGCGPVVVKWK